MNGNHVSISLELRLQDDTPAGRASDSGGREREFLGWLGLMGAIEALLDSGRPKEEL